MFTIQYIKLILFNSFSTIPISAKDNQDTIILRLSTECYSHILSVFTKTTYLLQHTNIGSRDNNNTERTLNIKSDDHTVDPEGQESGVERGIHVDAVGQADHGALGGELVAWSRRLEARVEVVR